MNSARLLKLLTILFTLVAIGAAGFYGFEHRNEAMSHLTGHKVAGAERIPNPGEVTKKLFKKYVDDHQNVEGINFGKVDFKQNTRSATWFYHKEPELAQAWAEWGDKPAPLFTRDEGVNQRLVNLINGQFGCVPVESSVAAMAVPLLKQFTVTLCQAPIPPEYGDFIGWVNIFFRQQPTPDEIDALQADMRVMTKEMYERDVLKTLK